MNNLEDLGCFGNYHFSQPGFVCNCSFRIRRGGFLGLFWGFFGVSVFWVSTAVVGATLCYLKIKLLYFSLLCPHHTAALQNKHSAFWSHFSKGCQEPAKGSHGMKNVELWEQHNCKQLCQ